MLLAFGMPDESSLNTSKKMLFSRLLLCNEKYNDFNYFDN